MTPFSVVMPAHNEAAVIGKSLAKLLAAGADDYEVVVVCNGCNDETAQAALSAGAHVIELATASKSAALNAGDAAARWFPRFYVDADIQVSAEDLRLMAELLDSGRYLAVAATVSHRSAASASWIVRSYYRFWAGLPASAGGIFGTGVIGLGAAGRARFDDWPDVIADDYFCDSLFTAAEKMRDTRVRVELDVPSRVAALVRRKARIYNGNREVRRRFPAAAPATRSGTLLDVVRRRPRLLVDAPAFVLVTYAGRLLAAIDRRRGFDTRWRRDDSRSAPRQ